MLQDYDRQFLGKALELARHVRRAPASLGLPLEPTWSAVLATPENILASEAFIPGNGQDAVALLHKNLSAGDLSTPNLTLYLTLEPFSTYERLPPVTESIRALNVKRVVIGAENPANRAHGKGIASLEKQGMEVLIADGEIARQCQLLYEDYAKASSRSLPILRLVWDLDGAFHTMDRLGFAVSKKAGADYQHDAILWSDLAAAKKFKGEAWVVALDPKSEILSADEFQSARVLIFQGTGQAKFYSAPNRDGEIDLASVLRKLRELGILSVLCRGDIALFQRALESELVDSVLSFIPKDDRPTAGILSQLSQCLVQCGTYSLRLVSPRILAEGADSLLVEAGVKLQ